MSVFDSMKGTPLSTGFKLQSEAPLDQRSQVELITDLGSLVEGSGAYEGIQVYVKATKTTYILKDLTGTTTLGKDKVSGTWEVLGTGAGGTSAGDLIFTVDPNTGKVTASTNVL